MPDGRRRRVEALFQQAADLPMAERSAFLDNECTAEPDVRAEVERLLLRFDADRPTVLHVDDRKGSESCVPKRIGLYTIRRVIGEGGWGVVYEAQQESPHRAVALKVIRPGLMSESMVRRFALEAHVLGQLQHPGIAQIFEAGTAAVEIQDGRVTDLPFLAMEFIHGQSLSEYLNQKQPGTGARLELIATICDAVQHAHQKGIIHRDLKPANIVVDESGQPKILDFGIARITDSDLQTTTLHTGFGQAIGTIPYMSPEQLGGDSRQLDTRSDVYALGVLCYEVLTGRQPFDLGHKAIVEAARIVREEEPTPLSSVNRVFRGDLETIVAKALAKDKDYRYSTASELAADIRRYLHDEPILARPPSLSYQLAKLVRRHRGLFAGVACSLLILVCGVIATSVLALREREQRRRAETQTGIAQHAEQRAIEGEKRAIAREQDAIHARALAERQSYANLLVAADIGLRANDPISANASLDRASSTLRGWEWRYLKHAADPSLATFAGHTYMVNSVAFSEDGALLASGSRDQTVRMWDCVTGKELYEQERGTPIFGVAFRRAFASDPEVVSVGIDGSIAVWTPRSRDQIGAIRVSDAFFGMMSIASNGSHVAYASNDSVIIGDVANYKNSTGRPDEVAAWQWGNRTLRASDSVSCVAFSHDGARIAAGVGDGTIRVWNLVDRTELGVSGVPRAGSKAGGTTAVCLNRDGSRAAHSYEDFSITTSDIASGETIAVLRGHNSRVTSLAMNAQGTLLASGALDGEVRLWDVQSGLILAVLYGHQSDVRTLAFNPAGTSLASGSGDTTVKLWDAGTRSQPVALAEGTPINQTFLNHTRTLLGAVLGVTDRQLVVWDLSTCAELGKRPLSSRDRVVEGLVYDDRLVILSGSHELHIWEPRTGRESAAALGKAVRVEAAVMSPGGRWLVLHEANGVIRRYDCKMETSVPVAAGTSLIVFSADDSRQAVVLADGTIECGDSESADPPTVVHASGATLSAMINPDGASVLTHMADGSARVWDMTTGSELLALAPQVVVGGVRFDPIGGRLLACSDVGALTVWDVRAGKLARTISMPALTPASQPTSNDRFFARSKSRHGKMRIEFPNLGISTSDDRLSRGPALASLRLIAANSVGAQAIVTTADPTTPLLCPLEGDAPPIPLVGHDDRVACIDFDIDGRRAITAGDDATVRVWDTEYGVELLALRGHSDPVTEAYFVNGGRSVLSISSTSARVWLAGRAQAAARE